MLPYLGRFLVIILGYAVAALAASAFLNLTFLASAGFSQEQAPTIASGALVFSVPFVALFVAYFAFMPAVAVHPGAEILGRRDWLFYALAGAVVAAVVIGMLTGMAETGQGSSDPRSHWRSSAAAWSAAWPTGWSPAVAPDAGASDARPISPAR